MVYDFNIPSQGIESALNLLAERTNAMLLFPYETVQLEESNPVAGKCTLNEALLVMLEGTSLRGDLTEGGVITISQNDNTVDGNKVLIDNLSGLGKDLTAANVLSMCGVANLSAQEITFENVELEAVSYTHLTLPTILLV